MRDHGGAGRGNAPLPYTNPPTAAAIRLLDALTTRSSRRQHRRHPSTTPFRPGDPVHAVCHSSPTRAHGPFPLPSLFFARHPGTHATSVRTAPSREPCSATARFGSMVMVASPPRRRTHPRDPEPDATHPPRLICRQRSALPSLLTEKSARHDREWPEGVGGWGWA